MSISEKEVVAQMLNWTTRHHMFDCGHNPSVSLILLVDLQQTWEFQVFYHAGDKNFCSGQYGSLPGWPSCDSMVILINLASNISLDVWMWKKILSVSERYAVPHLKLQTCETHFYVVLHFFGSFSRFVQGFTQFTHCLIKESSHSITIVTWCIRQVLKLFSGA